MTSTGEDLTASSWVRLIDHVLPLLGFRGLTRPHRFGPSAKRASRVAVRSDKGFTKHLGTKAVAFLEIWQFGLGSAFRRGVNGSVRIAGQVNDNRRSVEAVAIRGRWIERGIDGTSPVAWIERRRIGVRRPPTRDEAQRRRGRAVAARDHALCDAVEVLIDPDGKFAAIPCGIA